MLGLTGLFAPIATPYTDDADSISEIRLARLIRHLRDRGVDGFVACTDTGEFTTTSAGERKQILEILIRESQGAPVLAHCTRLGTAQSLDLCQHAGRHGALAAVIMPPYYGTFDDQEIEQHIRRIVQHAGLPIIVVDPQSRARPTVREPLCNMPNLYYAEAVPDPFRTNPNADSGRTTADEFAISEAVVSPIIQIDPLGAKAGSPNLSLLGRLVSQYGRARIAKAALTLRDVEVGPPRSPALPLPQTACEELVRLVQTN
ncbi:MAG TPA: dihydrodipicolinate synthase family protein [Fimbriimonadaceae bacterium]|nr:dihydrodipicolinate synthase family protein [Fimbriimonadaceae bacterium]